MTYTLTDAGADPSLMDSADALTADGFPDYMFWESPGNWRWHRLYELFPRQQLFALDERGTLAGVLNSVPLCWDGTVPGLPGGWDDAIVAAVDGTGTPTASCALAVAVAAPHRKAGVAELLLTEIRRRGRESGQRAVVVSLRPTAKQHYPLIPMTEYLRWRRDDGSPFDPWLRTHQSLGAEVLGVAERSMVIREPVSRWAELLGHPLPGPGSYLVPGGLVPIEVGVDRMGTYAEPNVWVSHAC